MDPETVTVRPVEAGDEEFLCALYASTREEELAAVAWSAGQKAAFLRMQFEAQHRHYVERYPGARLDVILAGGEPIGRLYVDRWPSEIRLMDIALVPAHRNRGIGGRLVRELMAEAAAAGKRLSIHVERFNPALRLYERLGFRPVGDEGVYLLMEWRPGGEGTAGCE
jgi:ribosomal protein S18 acetylase RimI-like enzyme